jgi:osmoprotectant transport system ATP-binding protein
MEIAFRSVTCRIAGRTIVEDLSFVIPSGRTLALVGPSGAGKTTLLRLVNALRLPDAGEVLVDGRLTTAWDPIELRRRTGYVLQEGGLFPHMTVAQNVGLAPRLLGWDSERIANRVRDLLEEVQLPPATFEARYPRQLSGGQRQRVSLARALATEPPILLLDEPFGALDPVTRIEMHRQFLDLRARHRKTVLLVTHDMSEALRLGHQVGLLYEGRLEALAEPAAFRQSTHPVVRAFLGEGA